MQRAPSPSQMTWVPVILRVSAKHFNCIGAWCLHCVTVLYMYMHVLSKFMSADSFLLCRCSCFYLSLLLDKLLGLTRADKNCLKSGAWLSANHISASNKLLRMTNCSQNGLQDTAILSYKSLWESVPKDFVQIIQQIFEAWLCWSVWFSTHYPPRRRWLNC